VLARALQGLGRFDEAGGGLSPVDRAPPGLCRGPQDWPSSSGCARGIGEARAALDDAIAAHPGEIPLRLAAAKLLEYAGDAEAAYSVLDEGLTEGLPDPRLDIAASQLRLETDPASRAGPCVTRLRRGLTTGLR